MNPSVTPLPQISGELPKHLGDLNDVGTHAKESKNQTFLALWTIIDDVEQAY
jgi:hypothetical protein